MTSFTRLTRHGGSVGSSIRSRFTRLPAYLDEGRSNSAALAALLLSAHAKERGDEAIGSGWLRRARRLLEDTAEAPEHGYLLYWDAFGAMGQGDFAKALPCAKRMQELGQRHGDPNLALAADEVETARVACAELRETATMYGTPGLEATARQARGALLLSDGEPGAALAELHVACQVWHHLDAAYEAARSRLLRARAYRALGDTDATMLELDAAEAAFERLGARIDLGRVQAIRSAPAAPPDGLSPREVEILLLVASGRTNRQISDELSISDKAVARHVANIFLKIRVNTRAAATAYAFERGLARPGAGA